MSEMESFMWNYAIEQVPWEFLEFQRNPNGIIDDCIIVIQIDETIQNDQRLITKSFTEFPNGGGAGVDWLTQQWITQLWSWLKLPIQLILLFQKFRLNLKTSVERQSRLPTFSTQKSFWFLRYLFFYWTTSSLIRHVIELTT